MSIATFLWIQAGVIIFIVLYLWSTFNSFIRGRNAVKTDFADIDVQLKRRASLIENLVSIVREYAKHEKDTFQGVAQARSMLQQPHGPQQSAKIENMLSSTLRSLFAVSESYPKLQASENFKQLQEEIKQTEDAIATYRETYNQTVLNYNTSLQTFPNLLAAGLFRFTEEELFDIPSEVDTEVHLKM